MLWIVLSASHNIETMNSYKKKIKNEKIEFLFIKKKTNKKVMIFAHYLN